MFDGIVSFLNRHNSFILTTHDSPDADGLGAELVFAHILKQAGKRVKIINASYVSEHLKFLTEGQEIKKWNYEEHTPLLRESALLILDTSDEFHLGAGREAIKKAKEVFVIDHHDLKPISKLSGFVDSSASSTSELSIEYACFTGVELDPVTATAAYAGIVLDSGFFAYPKTSIRTFKTAMKTLEWGAAPNQIYKQLMENSSCASLLLQKQALSSLKFYIGRLVAVMILRLEDFDEAGAVYSDVENIVNIPLKAKEVEAAVLIKEKEQGEVYCSLRSKGTLNVSKIAQNFRGGGHITAAGFMSSLGVDKTLEKLLSCLESSLEAKLLTGVEGRL